MQSCSATDVGQKRKVNQDYLFESQVPVGNLPNLFIVADGMGGHNAGDYASRFAVKTIVETIENSPEANPIKLIESAICAANAGIRRKASEKEELWGMGTTCVAASVIGGYLYVANVGDSRLYMLQDDKLIQITRDHSLVEEMVRIGQLTPEEARSHPDKHIITRALGASDSVDIDFFDQKVPPEGEILMCSDGLSNMVDDVSICHILEEQVTLKEKVDKLIRTANENGGKDNIAVVLVKPDSNEVD